MTQEQDILELPDDEPVSAFLGDLRKAGRFAPRPREWADFYEALTRGVAREDRPPLPLILTGHWATTAADKHRRLEEHLRWAASQGRLDVAIQYLRDLPEDDWSPLPVEQWDSASGGL